MVVYHIKCKNCKNDYIGKTDRILLIRIYEHEHSGIKSACYQHAKKNGHEMDYENVEVIDTASTDTKLRVKELLHILKKEPTLNKQLNSQSNHEIKTV